MDGKTSKDLVAAFVADGPEGLSMEDAFGVGGAVKCGSGGKEKYTGPSGGEPIARTDFVYE